MATVLGIAVAPLLAKAGMAVLSAAGSYVVKQGTDYAFGTDTDKIRKDIAAVSKEIAGVQLAISGLSDRLTDVLLQLRKDNLNQHCNNINTCYSSVMDLLETYFEHLQLPKDDKTKKGKIKDANVRIEELLLEVRSEIPKRLDQIHSFLSEAGQDSFLNVVAGRALVQSADFLAYYGKCKVLALGYWLCVAKGIALLELAAKYNTKFVEGAKTIERQKTQLELQVKVFNSTVGESCVELAEAVFSNPKDRHAVKFTAKNGWYIRKSSMYANHDFAITGPSVKENRWFIQTRDTLEQFDLTIGKKYAIHLIEGDTNSSIYMSGGQYGTYMDQGDPYNKINSWYIKPYQPGSGKFTIEFQSNYLGEVYNGQFVDVQEKSSMQCLMRIGNIAPQNDGTFYEFSLQK
jgi:hypothetical protein